MAVNNKVRNTNIEIFRFVLMVGILLWHLIIHGCGFSDIGKSDYNYSIHESIICCAIFAPSVNCFMFISGWFGMKFKAAKVMNLSLICVLSALICLVLKHYTILRGGHDIGLMNLYSAIFPISTIAWWFMTAYIMVLLISPFIENGIKLIAKKEFICVLVFMTLIEVLSIPAMRNFGSSFFGLLYIYLLGRYLSMYKIKLTGKKALLLFICMTALLMICLETLYFLPIKNSALFWFLQFNNPIIILQAVSLFFIVLNLKPIYNRHINKILQPCLCIYLLTELTQPYKLIVAQLDSNPILGIGIIIGALIVCLALGHVISYLADKIVSFSIPKVSNRFTM